MNKNFEIDETSFIYGTNFAGDPTKDSYGDSRRKANIIIPDPEMAKEMTKMGVKVRTTSPGKHDDPDNFVPKYFVTAILKYRDKENHPMKHPPRVYLASNGNEAKELTEDTVGLLDDISVSKVRVMLNLYEYDPVGHKNTAYIRILYAEQSMDNDPFAKYYKKSESETDESFEYGTF